MNLLLRPCTLSFLKNFVQSITSCLSKLKVTPCFCFPFKISDNQTATSNYNLFLILVMLFVSAVKLDIVVLSTLFALTQVHGLLTIQMQQKQNKMTFVLQTGWALMVSAEIYKQSAPNNSNETYIFMCLGRFGRC